jgi:hypothetical protein
MRIQELDVLAMLDTAKPEKKAERPVRPALDRRAGLTCSRCCSMNASQGPSLPSSGVVPMRVGRGAHGDRGGQGGRCGDRQ